MARCEGAADAAVGLDLPENIPGIHAVQSQSTTENFPVALRLLPAAVRTDLLAIYGFARLADDIGDEYEGDRVTALDWLQRDLDAAPHGRAAHPVVARLTPTIQRHDLDLSPFRDLIEANRRDQRQHEYATFDDLLGYCRLSANPVGRLVLAVFGVSDPTASALSDDVCSGLQVIEHLQDVGEDLLAGRIYLPREDLMAFGCTEADLARPAANAAVRRLIAAECMRALALLESGPRLVDLLPRQPRLAVAGFVAGGLAAVDAIEAAEFDVLGHQCRPSRRRVLAHGTTLLIAARRHGMRKQRSRDGRPPP